MQFFLQGIRVEEQKSGLPEYLEINNSYDAWGVRYWFLEYLETYIFLWL